MKICSTCKKNKRNSSFSFKYKITGKLESSCKFCMRKRIKDHYYKNRDYYIAKAKKRNHVVKIQIKNYIWKYFENHPCVDCGEKDPIVLEFDHISDKISAISDIYRNYTLAMIIKEIEKCQVRCANCHRRKTAERGDWYKNIKPL